MDNYSVLISVYKKAKPEELEMSINSMMLQTVKPEQFVIVLDGPVDRKLRDVVNSFEIEYPEVFTVVSLPENHGLAYALNEGLKVCRNSLVARMDSDDFSLPCRCEHQLSEFEKDKKLVLLGGHTQHFKKNINQLTGVYSKQPVSPKEIIKCIRRNSAFSHPTVMYRKQAVEECGGYDPELRRSQDHDLFSKMIAKGYKCKNLDEVLVLFRADDDCMLRNRSKESCKARIVIQKRLLKRGQCSIIDYWYIWLGVFLIQILPEKLYLRIYSLIKEEKPENHGRK